MNSEGFDPGAGLSWEQRVRSLLRRDVPLWCGHGNDKKFNDKKFNDKKDQSPLSYELRGLINPGAGLSLRAVSHQLLSLLSVFTFVFGMGTGVFRTH